MSYNTKRAHFPAPESVQKQNGCLRRNILENHADDIAALQKIGITQAAITAYIDRVQEGQSRQKAIAALMQGRVLLSEEQKNLVRTILSGFPIP